MALSGTATIDQIIAALQGYSGQNQKSELISRLTALGISASEAETMAALVAKVAPSSIPALIPSNIRQGTNICNVIGTLVPLTNEKRKASGITLSSTTTVKDKYDGDNYFVEVSGLPFKPSYVHLQNINFYGSGESVSVTIADTNIIPSTYHAPGSGHERYIRRLGLFHGGGGGTAQVIDFPFNENLLMTSNGFKLPVQLSNVNYTWVAYE